MVTNQHYYSVTLIVWSMKLKAKMFMKVLVRKKKCLILATILLSENIMIQTN